MLLAKSMKRDWSKIAKEFNSFKSRKACLSRFKVLEKQLSRFGSLEQVCVATNYVDPWGTDADALKLPLI